MSFLWASIAFLISVWMTRRLCDPTSRFHILDQPNHRSLHACPTPRSGGLAIVSGVCMGGIAVVFFRTGVADPVTGWIGMAALAVAGISYADDRLSLSPLYRLSVHVLAAALVIAGGLLLRRLDLPGIELSLPGGMGAAVTLLFVVWMVNLYNFMDGMDGFAGGMAVFGFGTFAILGAMAGDVLFYSLNLVIVAATLGFLVFNFPPARIFMGDVGSSTLGFLAAVFAVWGVARELFPPWCPILIFSPFIVDATVTLVRRLARREKVWEAHRSHYYQRLVGLGFEQRKVLLFQYAIMLGCAVSAVLSRRASATIQWGVLGAWGGIYVLYFWYVSKREAHVRRTG